MTWRTPTDATVGLCKASNGLYYQIKFNKQQRAKSHLQVAKTLIKTINILLTIRTEGERSNRNGITQNRLYIT